jgi:hypothetical protein
MSVTSDPQVTAAWPVVFPAVEGDPVEGARFTVEVSGTSHGAGGQVRAWNVWLSQGDGSERRRLGCVDSPEKPLCALCERPTAHGGVAAVAFSRADGSVELHELDAGGNSIHCSTEQR